MLKKRELTVIAINIIFVKMLLSFPRSVVENSANAAWLQIIYNAIIAVLFYYVIMKIHSGNRNIIETVSAAGGKYLRIAVSLLILIILLFNFINVMRGCSEIIKAVLLKDTNDRLVTIIFATTAAFGAYMGIEALGRVHFLFMPIGATVMLGFLLLLIPYYHLENAAPIFGNGIDSILGTGFGSLSLFSDIIIVNLLISNMENAGEAKQCGIKAIIISGILSFIIMAAFCLTYPYPASANFINPVYEMARMVHLSGFFSRFESFFEFIWTIMMFLYASVYLYAMCFTISSGFRLKYTRPLILPVTLISFAPVMLPAAYIRILNVDKFSNSYSWIFAFGIMLVCALLSHKTGKSCKKKEGIK